MRHGSAGTVDEATYFGPGSAMLGFTHRPQHHGDVGVVICSSLHAEFLRNYRREVLLARALCRQGTPVQRFQYRGEGNSLGPVDDITFPRLCEDAKAAADHLRERTGVSRVVFLGTRLGGLVAAAAASGETAPVVLWEPVFETDRYFREAFRARMIRELKEGGTVRPSVDSMVAELRAAGVVDILGYQIHFPLYESAIGRTLVTELGSCARPVLLVQITKSSEPRGDHDKVSAAWEDAGFAVERRVISEDEAWWYVGEDWQAEEARPATSALVEATCSWVAKIDAAATP